jgi:hypothetical protein
MATAWLTYYQSVTDVWSTVFFFFFGGGGAEYAVQFNTEDFHCGNLYKEEIVWIASYEV